MSERIRCFDWAGTRLGATDRWPQSLRTVVDLMLASAQPVYIGWGPDLVFLYNDGCIPLLGEVHPASLGRPCRDTRPEIWDALRPVAAAVMAGEARCSAERPMPLAARREGPMNSLSFSWTPLRIEDGSVGGVYCVAAEATEKGLSERALRANDRALFDALGQGYADLEMVRDPAGRAIDIRHLELNPSYERLTGIPADAARGRLVREVVPDFDAWWIEAYDRILRSGVPGRVEHEIAARDRWCEASVYPRDATRFSVIYEDISERKRAEIALRESEARQSLLIGAWAQAVWETDAGGVVVADSPSWRAYTGQTLDEWLGYGWLNAIHPDDRAYAERQWREAIAVRGLVDAEFRLRAPDGGWRWTNVRAAPVLDAQGQIAKWAGMNIDIEARKQAEAALRASEERHRAVLEQRIEEAVGETKASRHLLQATLDASTDMIQVFEAIRDEAGKIVDFRWILNNHTSEKHYGEVRGESLLTRNPGVVAEGIFDAFRRVTETGLPEQAERHYVHEQFDGWFYQSVVKLDDGVATTTKEISHWKAAQADVLRLTEEAAAATLRASEERFRSFAENSTDALWIVDARTRKLVYLSPAFERIWGERRAAVLEDLSRWAELVHPEDREQARAALPRALAGESVQIVYRIRRADDGQIRWIQDTGFPIRGPGGEIDHVGGISQDVTGQRDTAERLRENERRLLTVIQGIPQLVWRAADRGEWTWASPQWSDYTGQALEDSRGLGWLDVLHPDDRNEAMTGWLKADGSSPIDMETRLFHAREGRHRWFQTRALPVCDEDGRIVEWLGTSTDIDDMRQLQERQQVLVAELQHRTRNLIGVVRAMSERTAERTRDLPGFLTLFHARLGALARINSLLSKLDSGERVTFDQLLRTELEARGFPDDGTSEQVVLEGPAGVRLRSATVQTFALALHELATNAVKYGALSNGRGRLEVTWHVRRSGAGTDRLYVEWSESGVANMPEEGAAAQGGGYGRTLIEQALPYQLDAATTYEIRPDGVRCTIDLPLK